MIYLIDITNIDKIPDKIGQNFEFLSKMIGCKAQEWAGKCVVVTCYIHDYMIQFCKYISQLNYFILFNIDII